MPEISRTRKRAIARAARKSGPTAYTARQMAAGALAIFVVGAMIGTTAGLLLGGNSGEPRQSAERSEPAGAASAPATGENTRPTSDKIRSRGSDAAHLDKVPTSGYAQAPEPAQPPPTPDAATSPATGGAAEAPAGGPSGAQRLAGRIVDDGRRRAETAAKTPTQPQPAWQQNAAAHPNPAPGTAKIAIVIDDLGLNRSNARKTVALPGPLTLAFMTYAPRLGDLTEAARASGHELLVHVPMQPSDDSSDPGPKVLSGDLDRAELMARLDWGLSRFEGYVGINNHMGSGFTQHTEGMRAVLAELKRRGLMFLDSRTIASSVAGSLAKEMGVAHATRDVFLDNRRELGEIRAQLEKAERIARETGSAVAIGHPYDETIEALKAWLPTLGDKNIALVPISALAQSRGPDVARLPTGGE